MKGKAFFDTNVLIYALAARDPRTEAAEALLLEGGVTSVHVLNEFVSIARRKMSMPWQDVVDAIEAIRILSPSPVAIGMTTHERALGVAQEYGYQIYDALALASALEAKCDVIYSEDLQDGQVIEDRLTIRNPFSRLNPKPKA
jgi:predicted nucleic acid-binding protein